MSSGAYINKCISSSSPLPPTPICTITQHSPSPFPCNSSEMHQQSRPAKRKSTPRLRPKPYMQENLALLFPHIALKMRLSPSWVSFFLRGIWVRWKFKILRDGERNLQALIDVETLCPLLHRETDTARIFALIYGKLLGGRPRKLPETTHGAILWPRGKTYKNIGWVDFEFFFSVREILSLHNKVQTEGNYFSSTVIWAFVFTCEHILHKIGNLISKVSEFPQPKQPPIFFFEKYLLLLLPISPIFSSVFCKIFFLSNGAINA